METLNERAGFLCNYEVLAVLRQQRDERQARIKKLQSDRKNGVRPGEEFGTRDEIERIQPQDLHTVTFEALRYLEDAVHPTRRQTGPAVSALLDQLERLALTKAERLQVVNLAPRSLVELHVCIEDIIERFSDAEQEHLLALVRSHLGDAGTATTIAQQAELDRIQAESAAAAMEVDGAPDEVDEREAAAIQDDHALIDDVETWTRAGDNVEDDIDEVAD